MKKILSLILSIMMLATFMPVAFANGEETTEDTTDILTSYGLDYTVYYADPGDATGLTEVYLKSLTNDIGQLDTKRTYTNNAPVVRLDLGSVCNVKDILVFVGGSVNRAGSTIKYSVDGNSWYDVQATTTKHNDQGSGQSKLDLLAFQFTLNTPVNARFIEVTNTGTSKQVYLRAIGVYGTEVSPASFESSLPENGASGVSLDSAISFSFTGAELDAEVNPTVIFKAADNSDIACSAVVGEAAVTITPTKKLKSNTQYNVSISGLKDIYANEVEAAGISFTTEDTTNILTSYGLDYTVCYADPGDATGLTEVYLKSLTNDTRQLDTKRTYTNNAPVVRLDLGKVCDITSVLIYAGGSVNRAQSKLKYSIDGETWYDAEVNGNKYTSTNTSAVKLNSLSINYVMTSSVSARYIEVTNTGDNKAVYLNAIGVYGTSLEEGQIYYLKDASYDEESSTVTGKVTLYNATSEETKDKYYLFAVYVNDSLYKVIPCEKSSATVAAGKVGNTVPFSCTLPETTAAETVSVKLFIWSDSKTIVPVTTPLDVL